jgi:hypothetical protein
MPVQKKWSFVSLFWCVVLTTSVHAKAERMVRLPQVERQALLPHPLIFPRIRTPHNLFKNYYQNFYEQGWVDRPLLHDSSLDNADVANRTFQNYKTHLEQAMDYGLDGLSMLYHGNIHFSRFCDLVNTADLCYDTTANQVFISILGHILRNGPQAAADEFEPVLKRMLASPAAARIGGKVVVGSYRTDYINPEQLAEFIKILHDRCGDQFVFISTIASLKGKDLTNYIRFRVAFDNNDGMLPESEVEAAKEYLRRYLRVSDGLLMNGVNHLDTEDHHFHQRFYREFVTRIFASVLAEPEFKGKILGLSAALGYVNHIAAGTQRENGTRTLRESLEIAYEAKPDFIIMPEWNEVNENTCLEPTVNRSFSSKRIIRYYTQEAKGRFSPLPGDNTAVPNLIVSVRAMIKAGDHYFVELLNVPDNRDVQKCLVQCILKDEQGAVIRKFHPREFDSSRLMEHRLTLSPAELAHHRVIKPELEITLSSGEKLTIADGLPFTKLRSTWNTNLTCLKQPLRDLAVLKTFKVRFSISNSNSAVFNVEAEAKADPIRHLEILEDDQVAYSYDEAGRYALGDNEALLHFSYNSSREIKPFPIKISVSDGKIRYFQDRLRLGSKRESNWVVGQEVTMNWKSNCHRRGGIFIVTDKDRAILNISSPEFNEHIKVAQLERDGLLKKTYRNTVNLCLETQRRALDVPAPANASNVRFATTLTPTNPGALYRVRLTTMSGRTFTKGPYLIPLKNRDATTKLGLLSEETGQRFQVTLDKSRLPDLRYEARPEWGTVLKSHWEQRWDGTLGGGAAQGGAFQNMRNYPRNSTFTAPTLIPDGDRYLLEFDGKGNYLHFPPETMPASANFTLEFEFKPFSLKRQRLITSHGDFVGMLDIDIVDGSIQCLYRAKIDHGEMPYFKEIKFSAAKPLKLNQWNRVELTYDLIKFRLRVNDAQALETPCSRVSWYLFNPMTFGGWGDDPEVYFKGLLKSFRIRHYVDDIQE